LAGFAVGAVERSQILPSPDIQAGDVVLGLASSGLHSNGFSLVRKIIDRAGLTYSDPCPWDDKNSLGRTLLEPTKIYIKQLLPAIHAGLIKGMSHITGGGFIENVPRVLPKDLGCRIDAAAWEYPQVFRFLAKHGGVAPLEMARTFNNGIGMVVIVGAAQVDSAIALLRQSDGTPVYRIGEIVSEIGVHMENLHTWQI
jgi:phosphoribosylamine--glycine ligase / phosphoribosylformylglycinamidine cyclo-ligase